VYLETHLYVSILQYHISWSVLWEHIYISRWYLMIATVHYIMYL